MSDRVSNHPSSLMEKFITRVVPRFEVEAFRPVSRRVRGDKETPTGELLFRGVDDRENLFKQTEAAGLSLEVDEALFRRAAKLAQFLPDGGSVNVHTGTIFSTQFVDTLHGLAKERWFNPSLVTIEVTEQGRLPNSANLSSLSGLLGMGFRLAVDDIDPRDKENMRRVHAIDGAATMHKFPHQMMKAIRVGGEKKEQALDAVADLRRDYRKSVFVMEGVLVSDQPYLQTLHGAGIDVIQRYTPTTRAGFSRFSV